MKVSADKLRVKLAKMTRDELADFAFNIVFTLYGSWHDQTDTCEDEPDTSFAEGEAVLDSEREWSQDEIEIVGSECESAGIHPSQVP
jgi:hypothetical protein